MEINVALVIIFVCIDYLYDLPDYCLNRLQNLMGTAVRILCGLPKFYHITDVLMNLH